MLQPASRIGNYIVDRHIGSGGMALVYLAHHAVLGEPVALKVLLPNLAMNPKVLERFRREAQVQFRFRHDHIVRVTDYVEEGSIAALAMEYVEGEALDAYLLASGPLAWARALELLRPVVSALAYAHQQGVVHRDLKPGNVLLDQRAGGTGAPKVTDFGIAKVLDSEAGLTGTNARMGTWGYMAPEQFRGAKEVDARADVFALGMVVWEAIAGRLPFNPEDQFAVMQTYGGMLAIPRLDAVAECPAWLADVVAQAVSIDPAGRFQDAGVLGRVLERGNNQVSGTPAIVQESSILRGAAGAHAARGEKSGESGRAETPRATAVNAEPLVPTSRLPPPTVDPSGERRAVAAVFLLAFSIIAAVAWLAGIGADPARPDVSPNGALPVTAPSPLAVATPPSEAAAPQTRLTVDGDTVYDSETKLTWQRTVSTRSYTRAAAMSYCRDLARTDESSWRVPAKTELESLLRPGAGPTIDRVAFPQEQTDRSFWTSTPWVSGGNAWLIGFDVGHGYPGDQWSPYWVRCVR